MNREDEDLNRLLTIQQASGFLGLTVGTLYQFVSQKRIPVVRISRRCIRFRLSDLSSWIDQLTEHPVSFEGFRGTGVRARSKTL